MSAETEALAEIGETWGVEGQIWSRRQVSKVIAEHGLNTDDTAYLWDCLGHGEYFPAERILFALGY